ncbi:DUF423 domain-containing protein [Novilysobacter antarcticus]|uniref:DUF423 domain-containing protein n=1 Tax=Novilysobacter antarcticus TaxID=2862543 RepID=UPI001C994112|nr:DUF423 domain-containing protein [Lysobacter antarcticus]
MKPESAGDSSGSDSATVLRVLSCVGALLAGSSVALAAYAVHAGDPAAQERLQSAAWFAFGHGIALTALAPRAVGMPGLAALLSLATGTLLFSGSLVGAHFFATPTAPAPLGGGLMMLGWLLWAAASVRRRRGSGDR